MLIRFSVSNFLSFKEKNTFDMVAGGTETFKEHTYKGEKDNFSILKSGVIYGANASGKSNFVRAISFAQKAIIEELKGINTMNKHFRLDEKYLKEPSVFQFEIKIDNKYYDYGFAIILNQKKIIEEWLYEKRKTADDKCIFYREINKELIHYKFKNKENTDRINLYYEDLGDESLFLHELAFIKKWKGKELEVIKDVFLWFRNNLTIIFPDDKEGMLLFLNEHQKLEGYLKNLDTGIEKVSLENKNFDDWLKNMPLLLREKIQNDLFEFEKEANELNRTEEKNKSIGVMTIISGIPYLINISKDTKTVKVLNFSHIDTSKELFELSDESDGTKRLIELIPILHKKAELGKTLIIDEIDRSFHPALTKKIFKIFFEISKDSSSQLIVTTHDTTLLDLEFLRRDEIWFVNREDDKSSKLYSLEEFKERKDKKINKAYLLGRYGGVPVFGNFEFLKSDNE